MKRKIILDAVMATIMICLLNLNFTGNTLHEILGISVFFLFAFHKILNFKWIKAVTINLFKKNINTKTKIMYAVDVILLVLIVLNVVTGILISTCILTDITADDIGTTSTLHHVLAYLLFSALIVHISLHGAFIRKATKMKKGGLAEKIVLCAFSVIITMVLMGSNTLKKYLMSPENIRPLYQGESAESSEERSEGGKDNDSESDTEKNEIPKGESSKDDSANDNDDSEEDTSSDGGRPTIEEFLSKLMCKSCGRRCLLISPDCSRGRQQQQQQVQVYNQTYGTNESYTSSGNKKPR